MKHVNSKKNKNSTKTVSLEDETEEPVVFDFPDLRCKPLCRGAVDCEKLFAICDQHNLLNGHDWTENDMRAVANIAIGTHFAFTTSDPNFGKLKQLKVKMDAEITGSVYFQQLMDPTHMLIHTLPVQADNRTPENNSGFTYAIWPAPQRNSLKVVDVKAIEASQSNCPTEWFNNTDPVNPTGILVDAQKALYHFKFHLGESVPAIPPILGSKTALFELVAGNPFMLTFQNQQDLGVVMAALEGAMRVRFNPFIGFSYIMFDTPTTLDFVTHA